MIYLLIYLFGQTAEVPGLVGSDPEGFAVACGQNTLVVKLVGMIGSLVLVPQHLRPCLSLFLFYGKVGRVQSPCLVDHYQIDLCCLLLELVCHCRYNFL